MSEKLIGYLLLILGIALIAGAGYNGYQLLTKEVRPVTIFDFSSVTINSRSLVNEPPEEINLEGVSSEQEEVLEELIETQREELSQEEDASQNSNGTEIELVPGDVLSSTANFFAHLFLIGFLATIGQKIASIGVMMVRAIKVNLKMKEESPYQQE